MKILLANPPCRIDLENGKERFFNEANKKWLRYKLKDPKWVLRQIKNLNRLRKEYNNKFMLNKIKRGFKQVIE